MVEANLSRTFAADAPSHRAAWRRIEQYGSIYESLRPGSAEGDDAAEVTTDESKISRLATSVPMGIILPQARSRPVLPLERKTSLSEREGVLVPSLMKAMRKDSDRRSGSSGESEERLTSRTLLPASLAREIETDQERESRETSEQTPALASASTPLRRNSRSVSGTRERDQLRSYAHDPGAVFESLADGSDSGDDENEEGELAGTLRDSSGRTFVPPHLLARKESQDGDVGWRSMAS
jgi:hypothetical protein